MPGKDGTGPIGRRNSDLAGKGMNGCRGFGGQGSGMGHRQGMGQGRGMGMRQGQCDGTGRKVNPNCDGSHRQLRGGSNNA